MEFWRSFEFVGGLNRGFLKETKIINFSTCFIFKTNLTKRKNDFEKDFGASFQLFLMFLAGCLRWSLHFLGVQVELSQVGPGVW